MASASYLQRGETLDYKNNGDSKIDANTIIVYGARIGVTGCEILPGAVGTLHVAGVFELPKKDNTAINAGVDVYWNPDSTAPGVTASADDGETTPTAYVKVGYAAYAAAASDTTILVKVNA